MTLAELQELRRVLDEELSRHRPLVPTTLLVNRELVESCRTALDELIENFGS
jgi:hypothetical protein